MQGFVSGGVDKIMISVGGGSVGGHGPPTGWIFRFAPPHCLPIKSLVAPHAPTVDKFSTRSNFCAIFCKNLAPHHESGADPIHWGAWPPSSNEKLLKGNCTVCELAGVGTFYFSLQITVNMPCFLPLLAFWSTNVSIWSFPNFGPKLKWQFFSEIFAEKYPKW